jgi:predicted nucleic acid-binding protein
MVVDASVWVSRFLSQDAFHAVSRTWLIETTVAGTSLVAPTIMLAEVSGAIARRVGDVKLGYQIVQQIRQLPTLQLTALDESLAQFSAQIASHYQLRGADAIYVAVAHHLQMPLVSWDQEQIDRSTNLITAYMPAQEA